jgi:hypothetical protein
VFLCNGRACALDLSDGSSSEQELSEELLMKGSAVKAAESLRAEHDDALVFGAGVLTGSLVPAACAGFVCSSRGVMPLLGFAGVELKLAGFDFIVVKGESQTPGYVWVRDGIAEFVSQEGMSSMDSWERIERIRTDQGDRRIQVVSSGPLGDALHAASPLSVGHWLGEDDSFMGPEFGRRRLLAFAFRGMGELGVSDPEGHLSASLELRAEHAARLGPSRGLASYWGGADDSGFASLLHRPVSCFGCPHPCRSFLKVNEDPRQMSLASKEPGYLHFDIPSLDAALSSGLSIKDSTLISMECAKAGVDVESVIRSGASDLAGARSLIASQDMSPADRASAPGSFRSCASFEDCLGLGLCPRYWAKAGLDLTSLSECVEAALGRPLG